MPFEQVRKSLFSMETAAEVTQDVLNKLPKEDNVPVAAGDLCAYTITSKKVSPPPRHHSANWEGKGQRGGELPSSLSLCCSSIRKLQ